MANTPIKELLDLIPSGQEIKQAIFDNDMDEKMLDEWLWERLYKGKDWIEKEKSIIIDAYNSGGFESVEMDGEKYYKDNFTNPINKTN